MMRTLIVTVTAAVLLLGAGTQFVLADALNDYRKANGAKALGYSKELERAALAHAQDMAKNGFRSHTGSDGSDVGKRVRRVGYKWCQLSENITWGRSSYAKAIAAWDASPGHKKNMLRKKSREYGVAGVDGIWVMVLARRC